MLLLIYSVTLLAAVLVSEHFKRTLLSSAVLFLLVGFLVGPHGAGWVSLSVSDDIVRSLSDWALVTILFSDALHVKWPDLKGTWRLSGRALLLGLPLTLLGIALAGRLMIGLSWHEALLLGAILSPTDPVFASAIVGRQEIPARLRSLLNVESGLNDGLALPLVILLMGLTIGQDADVWTQVREVLGGVVFGIAIALAAGLLRRLRISRVSELAAPLHALAVMLITYSAGTALHLNPYLAAYSARTHPRLGLSTGGRRLLGAGSRTFAAPETGGGPDLRRDAEQPGDQAALDGLRLRGRRADRGEIRRARESRSSGAACPGPSGSRRPGSARKGSRPWCTVSCCSTRRWRAG